MKYNSCMPGVCAGRRAVALMLTVAAAALLALAGGCGVQTQREAKMKDLSYTIVENGQIPEKLAEVIEEKKGTQFKLSFENEGSLYLVCGYGEQETGGYSIAVRQLYLTRSALYFDTELLGPKNGSNPPKKPSYPYIVVKTEKQKQNIVFE